MYFAKRNKLNNNKKLIDKKKQNVHTLIFRIFFYSIITYFFF